MSTFGHFSSYFPLIVTWAFSLFCIDFRSPWQETVMGKRIKKMFCVTRKYSLTENCVSLLNRWYLLFLHLIVCVQTESYAEYHGRNINGSSISSVWRRFILNIFVVSVLILLPNAGVLFCNRLKTLLFASFVICLSHLPHRCTLLESYTVWIA
jgi:hypothetical protein